MFRLYSLYNIVPVYMLTTGTPLPTRTFYIYIKDIIYHLLHCSSLSNCIYKVSPYTTVSLVHLAADATFYENKHCHTHTWPSRILQFLINHANFYIQVRKTGVSPLQASVNLVQTTHPLVQCQVDILCYFSWFGT